MDVSTVGLGKEILKMEKVFVALIIGKFIDINNDTYIGAWKDDKRHGYGVHTFANGDKYDGYWKEDQKHGHGNLI